MIYKGIKYIASADKDLICFCFPAIPNTYHNTTISISDWWKMRKFYDWTIWLFYIFLLKK